MKKLSSYEIRNMWLKFFESKGHKVLPSASLIPVDDPTLLWINAGVAPLKKYFDGREIPSNPRLCNAQKSIRTNDIENVGKTARHHTFFEMLGNFSIGNYFRNEAIEMASELLFDDKWFGIDKNLIYITYYPNDLDTFNKWISCGVSKSHLIPLEDNFWEIGEGPCGPDTEIFFDRGEKYDPQKLGIKMLEEDIENDRYIEIWNIVLSQFNSMPGVPRNEYKELPSKNIDTGSGLERLACIFQGTDSNYETDLFLPMIQYVESICKYKYFDSSKDVVMAFRVIVDHIRSLTFAIADGAMLSNEGRGYVLRRILRRAVRYGRKLGINKPFLYKIVSIVVDNMKSFYGYLEEKQQIIEKVVKTEEENFLRTLEAGEKKLQEIISKSNNGIISGVDAFLLYDTFGFPIELTVEASLDQNIKVDLEGFNKALLEQKSRARNARSDQQSMNTQNEEFLNFKENSEFIGYDNLINENAKVIGIFKNGKLVNKASGLVYIVLDKTCFYALSGGQMGDQGTFTLNEHLFKVYDTFKLPNNQHAHLVDFGNSTVCLNDKVIASVDEKVRFEASCNHSATHLLNQALREVLGNHVVQQGSQVTQEGLRFDFNHYQNLTNEEILKVEQIVNREIKAAHNVNIIETSLEYAKQVGAQAEFGEKYGEVVRLVDMDFSKELCGGTHVKNTSEIGKFALVNIESKGSGIFRAEASSNANLYAFIVERLNNYKNEITSINAKINEIWIKLKDLDIKTELNQVELPIIQGSYQDILNFKCAFEQARKNLKEIQKQYDDVNRRLNALDYKRFVNEMIKSNDTNILVKRLENQDINSVKDVIDNIANQFDNCFIFFAIIYSDKINFIAKSKGNNIHCGNLVKLAATLTGGNGGGRPDFAQAGGKNVDNVDNALKSVLEKVM